MARAIDSGKKTKLHYEILTRVACGTKCPATGGHPLRITKNAWDIVCSSKRKKGLPAQSGRELYGRFTGEKYNACKVCKGKSVPSEVEFISAEEVARIGGR